MYFVGEMDRTTSVLSQPSTTLIVIFNLLLVSLHLQHETINLCKAMYTNRWLSAGRRIQLRLVFYMM